MTVVAWLRVSIQPGTHDTAQPVPVDLELCAQPYQQLAAGLAVEQHHQSVEQHHQ
jgi:hypothetical protein